MSTDPAREARNPYDREDTCRCNAWSENECGCGGYVDLGKVRAWQRGYDAARAEQAPLVARAEAAEATVKRVEALAAEEDES